MPNTTHNGKDLRSLEEVKAVVEDLPNVKIYLLLSTASKNAKLLASHMEALVAAIRVYSVPDSEISKQVRAHYSTEDRSLTAATAGLMFNQEGTHLIRLTKLGSESFQKVSQAYLSA